MYLSTNGGFSSFPGQDLAANQVVIYHVDTSSFSAYDI